MNNSIYRFVKLKKKSARYILLDITLFVHPDKHPQIILTTCSRVNRIILDWIGGSDWMQNQRTLISNKICIC